MNNAEIKEDIENTRPSNKELIKFIANNFNVSYGTVCDWILDAAEEMSTSP